MNAWLSGSRYPASAVSDAEPGEHEPCRSGGERGAVVGPERQLPGPDAVLGDGVLDDGDRLLGAAADGEVPADDLAGAAVDDRVQIAPAVLGDPDRGHVQVPQLAGALDPEEPGPAPARLGPPALDQLALAHHAQHPLAVHRPTEPAADPGGHDPIPVGRVLLGDLDDRLLDLVGRRALARIQRPPGSGDAVDRLAADLQHARHDRNLVAAVDELARPGDALVHSQPRNASPAISSS